MKILPQEFVEQAKTLFGSDFSAFKASLNSDSPTTIRMNDKLDKVLDFEQVAWCKNGFYLPQRPNFTLDPFFHAGVYYVQEASSMFLQQFLQQFVPKNALMLDLCAAPGGKSTLLSQYLSEKGFLVSNEFVRNRAHILVENLTKWGNDNFLITNNSPADFESYSNFFDVVLVDAPCSGEGMFRKDATAISEWSPRNVQMCAVRQKEILQSAWKTLKTDGILIYSTCTFNRQENEEIVQWLVNEYDTEILKIELNSSWGITETAEGYHFYPHKVKGEGLFMTAVRKLSGGFTSKIKVKNGKNCVQKPTLNGLQNSEKYSAYLHRNVWCALPKMWENTIFQLLQNLNVISCGIEICEQKGKDFIPQAALALSKKLNRNFSPEIPLSQGEALAFLRSETLVKNDFPKGFCVVTYKNIPLGWVKNAGNRCNNLYPNAWRIRMDFDRNDLPNDLFLGKSIFFLPPFSPPLTR